MGNWEVVEELKEAKRNEEYVWLGFLVLWSSVLIPLEAFGKGVAKIIDKVEGGD